MRCGLENQADEMECNANCRYFLTCTRCRSEDQAAVQKMNECDLIQEYRKRPKILNGKCTGFKIKNSAEPFFTCQICDAYSRRTNSENS